jgi:hypothetical protein
MYKVSEVYPSKALEMAKNAAINEAFHLVVGTGGASNKPVTVKLVRSNKKITIPSNVQKK